MHSSALVPLLPCHFATAVAAAAVNLPALTRATAYSEDGWHSVRLTFTTGPAIHTEASRSPAEALARFVAASEDLPNEATVEPQTSTAAVIPPLHPSAHALFSLTPIEQETSRLFALPAALTEDGQGAAVAVCQFVPREQWSRIEPGQMLVYNELHQYDDIDGPHRTLTTHAGPLRTYDARRGLFYADSWRNADESLDFIADDIQEVWAVQRLIRT